MRDQLPRVFLILAIFSITGIFLVPWLSHDRGDYQIQQPVDFGPPAHVDSGAGGQDGSSGSGLHSGGGTTAAPNAPARPSSDAASGLPSTFSVGKVPGSSFAIASPNGRYRFSLDAASGGGALTLVDTATDTELFSTDTEYHWPVEWHVELTPAGELRLSWTNDSASAAPHRGTPWASSMLPGCDVSRRQKPAGERGAADETGQASPQLQLLDTGMLRIQSGQRDTLCLLRRGADDKGKLAIVYGGLLRTYLSTCEQHRKKFVDTWTGSGGVDVHVFGYYEQVVHPQGDEVTEASVRAHLEECFGESLKTVELRRLADVEETVGGVNSTDADESLPDVLLFRCPKAKLSHQLSQFKSLSLVAEQVQRYMVETGTRYDYIFKARLDLEIWGDVPPLSSLRLPQNGIIAPRVYYDWTWYTLLHDGELRAGVTDIAAFGRPAHMFTWLSLYKEFLRLRSVEKEKGKWKAVNTKERDRSLDNKEHCTPEGILAYWLAINNIEVKTDWRFQMGLLRESGQLIFTCPEKTRDWLCPGL